ncbi:MAG TPA: hypothetical protein VN428_20295 [Bryobacteraceae bacterium]|nr:hypothetical protein [Bryobacteraceae bacterium]
MRCSNVVATQTRAVRGPGGVAAVLKIYSEDDHSKDRHDCRADYQLLLLPANGGPALVVKLLSSDAGWARPLSVQLDGFSHDGKRLFGVPYEGGKYAFATLFDYDITSREAKLIDFKRGLAQLKAVKCGARVAVAGTTGNGSIVVEPNTADQCPSNDRWLLDPSTGELALLPLEQAVVGLYRADRQR